MWALAVSLFVVCRLFVALIYVVIFIWMFFFYRSAVSLSLFLGVNFCASIFLLQIYFRAKILTVESTQILHVGFKMFCFYESNLFFFCLKKI